VTLLGGARIELWVEERGGTAAVNPIMRSLLNELAAAGAATTVRVPEFELIDPERSRHTSLPDLVLLKTATSLGLSWAVALERTGARFLNAARDTLRTHDKGASLARLAAAGLPVPQTFLVAAGAAPGPPRDFALDESAWVSKPTRGVHGRGVQLHQHFPAGAIAPALFDATDSYVVDDGTRLIQRLIGNGQSDLKVYVAGNQCFAGIKRFSGTSFASDRIAASALPRSAASVVHGVGEALGLRCFGVDLRFENERPVIIDANPFPGFRGFPAAVAALRAEIERALELDR
jgi:ribosomal protein S6--L-glutamate ligase